MYLRHIIETFSFNMYLNGILRQIFSSRSRLEFQTSFFLSNPYLTKYVLAYLLFSRRYLYQILVKDKCQHHKEIQVKCQHHKKNDVSYF